jgi:hypothetical protein
METASQYGVPPTAEEVAELRRLADDGLSAAAIAERMGRTRAGIVKKAVSKRLSLDPRKRRPQ